MPRPLRIAITPGEPGGIGPDLALALRSPEPGVELVVVADRALLAARAGILGMACAELATGGDPAAGHWLHVPGCRNPAPGVADPANTPYVLATLERALEGCLSGEFDALVTGPVQKSAINAAGFPFTGHTEYLARAAGAGVPVMMLVAGTLRVALATTHLPLVQVAPTLTTALLDHVIVRVYRALQTDFGVAAPVLGVCGVNPHAGEGGYLGREEIDLIAPVLAAQRAKGWRLEGPLPADTAFTPRLRERYDAYISMFHDQGLPVLKALGFGEAVNVTLGLPFIRTSVDHGTALELAGTGRAEAGSFRAALALAVSMARRRQP